MLTGHKIVIISVVVLMLPTGGCHSLSNPKGTELSIRTVWQSRGVDIRNKVAEVGLRRLLCLYVSIDPLGILHKSQCRERFLDPTHPMIKLTFCEGNLSGGLSV